MLKMSWFSPSFLPDIFKKKVCRYLLQRYLGQFLEEKLTLEQLNVDITNGTGTVNDVNLYCQALNELCETHEWGIEVIGGRIGSVTVTVPWNALMTEDSFIHVTDLHIALKPHIRPKDETTSMLESVWSSMSSSMQLAQECLEKEGGLASAQSNVMEGLERFAQTIDNVLNRVKARLTNTEIRLEYLPPDSDRGIAIIIKISNIEYQNEAGNDPPDKENLSDDENTEANSKIKQKYILISTYAIHNIVMDGITFYTEEFRVHLGENKNTPVNEQSCMMTSDQFFSTISSLPENEEFYKNTQSSGKDDTNSNESEDCDEDNEIEIFHTEPILIGKVLGKQEIRIKMKQADTVPGPKVQLEVSLGTISLFLSPRQLHLVLALCDVLLSDGIVNDENQQPPSSMEHSNMQQSPMDVDFKKFGLRKFNAMSGEIGLNQGWSSENSGDLYENTVFNTSSHMGLSESVMSTNSSMTSSMASSTSNYTHNSRKSRRRQIDLDSNADISNFTIQIGCLTLVLLHEDILMECSSPLAETPLSDTSVQTLKLKATNYFNKIGFIKIGLGANDIASSIQIMDEACKSHHLRLLAGPIVIDGQDQRNSNGIQLKISNSIGRLDLREILNDVCVPLLNFPRDRHDNQQIRPDVIINFLQLHKAIRGTNGRKFAPPKIDINFSLSSCQLEFDISIIDRISLIINPSPFPSKVGKVGGGQKSNDNAFSINLESTNLDLKLRFPIADLRPIHDPQRVPWWERNIRPDYLLLTLQQIKITTNSTLKYELISNEINFYYCENEHTSGDIHLGQTKLHETVGTRFKPCIIDYPKCILEFITETKVNNKKSKCDELNGESSGGIDSKMDSTPFTSKRICRESDTPHNKSSDDESEPLLIPGDTTEMENFCHGAMKNSKIQLNIYLPVVSLQLKSKHIYEVLYNRLNSDLIMWESRAPNFTPSNQQQQTPTSHSLLNIGMMDSIYMPFNMCTSELNCESSSSTTNSESESENDVYYSVVDKKNIKRPLAAATCQKETNNTLAFRLNVNQGVISMFTPVRDSQNHVIPGQLGEFLLKFKTAYVFSVAGYQGNENLGYFCLQAKAAELYHCGLIPTPSEEPLLYTINSAIPHYLQSTMYPTPKNLVQKEMKGSGDRGMVSLAVQIKANPDQRRKKIKVTVGVQLATLRHYFTASQYTWLTQLTDMFDVVDYPVQGYTPYNVLTELHLHIWDCAIDYRPLYFNYRAILTVGTFMVSSNIVTSSTGCTLRFIAEDCTLSLAPQSVSIKSKQRNSTDNNKITVLPMEDLVCIVDLGLLEISLRLNEKATSAFPKLDLRTSISDIHIRTCSDSGRALAQFIAYIAAEGDLEEIDDESSRQSDTMSITSENESDLLSVRSSSTNIPEVTHSQQQRVNTLMADAMEESLRIQTATNTEDVTPTTEGVEIFFFPDETNMAQLQQKQRVEIDNQIKITSNDEFIDSTESLDDFKKSKVKHMPSTSEFDDDSFTNMFGREATGDNDSINTEIRELLDFETSVMSMKQNTVNEVVEVIPQVSRDLGEITQITTNTGKDTVAKSRKISSDTDDDFCFIAEEEKVDYTGRMQEVPMCEEPIRIVDNHFSLPYGKPDLLQAPKEFPMAVVRYTLCEMSLCWHLYGGHDFLTDEEKRNKSKTDRTKQVSRYHTLPMSEAYKMGVSFSKGSPKVNIGGVCEKLTWKTRGGDERKHEVLMEIQINKVRFSHETYPSYTEQASRQVLLVTELEIRDRVEVSNINKFLYHPAVGPKAKHGSRHMVVLKALHLRPDPTLPAQECCLRISLLPLRLNIDQDSLEFLVTFLTDLSGDDSEEITPPKPQSTPSHQPPVMMVEIPEAAQELQARKMVSENLLLLMEEEDSKNSDTIEASSEMSADSSPIYFRNIIFGPEVPIRLDYHGKRVEFNRGPIAGLIMGLGQLQCSEIKLKPISHRHGILGVDRLLNFMLKEWLHDIKRNQLPSILSGVGPMHSLVQLFQGIRDLFWLPIEQYQKDGRIVRGLQLGAQSFTARTALAALEITTRIIHLLQITAETAYDMVSPGPSVRRSRGNRKGKRKRFNPPQDIREGVASAYQIVKEGIGETAHQIVEVAALEHDQKGYTGAIGAVVRQIPPTVVRPIVLATQATSKVLGGVRNQLVPDARTEAKEKWKDDEDE